MQLVILTLYMSEIEFAGHVCGTTIPRGAECIVWTYNTFAVRSKIFEFSQFTLVTFVIVIDVVIPTNTLTIMYVVCT